MSARQFIAIGRKIVAIGRNYSEHAKELNSTVPKAPMFFLKPTSSYVEPPHPIEIPDGCEVHHEVELGVVIGREGRDIDPSKAEDYIDGYALAIDMTARDIQRSAIQQGLPWTVAKGFDTFTPVGPWIPKHLIGDPHQVQLQLWVNEQIRQDGNTKDMIFKIPELISAISSVMRLEPGDLILTGTPKGVGPVKAGEILKAKMCFQNQVLSELTFKTVNRHGLFQSFNTK
jgi:acylpyruvate hydrolase